VVGSVIEMTLSYLMHPYRPRFNVSKVGEIWSYSIWLLVQSLGRFFETRIDEVAVGHVASPASMGRYTVSAELGALPMTELLEPVGRALFPNYARIAANPTLLRDIYLRVLAVAATICLSFGAGLALVSRDLIEVLLGPQWVSAAPLMVWFAAAGAINGINNTVFSVFNACGESRLSATQTWMRVVVYLPVVVWAASTGELANFAIARLAVSALLSPTFFIRLRRVIPVTWGQLGAAVWRPFCASAIMIIAMLSTDFHALTSNVFVRLPLEAAVGGTIFIASLLSLWFIAGAPSGAESALIGLLRDRLRRNRPTGNQTSSKRTA
jgi:O-antigen/teichoic acid export membrane protein